MISPPPALKNAASRLRTYQAYVCSGDSQQHHIRRSHITNCGAAAVLEFQAAWTRRTQHYNGEIFHQDFLPFPSIYLPPSKWSWILTFLMCHIFDHFANTCIEKLWICKIFGKSYGDVGSKCSFYLTHKSDSIVLYVYCAWETRILFLQLHIHCSNHTALFV